MQTMSIVGQQRNCEDAKRMIEELVEISTKRDCHKQIEVCAWNAVFLASVFY